ncbi:MAG TPA: LytTR family DNA-binding domain-containing protein [Segetibacter sp.]
MRVLIVDDEPLAVKLLKDYVETDSTLQLVLATTEVFEALKLVQAGKVDLVFLDILMPELTGIQFMKIMKGQCAVIITTAYPDFALQGYEFDVIDYLLKPFSPERFSIAVQKALQRKRNVQEDRVNHDTDFIFIKSEYRMVKIMLADILYLEALRDYIAIHTHHAKMLTLESLRSFEERLPSQLFLRVHKSYLISITKISAVEKKQLWIEKSAIPIGDTYLESFRKRLPMC